MWPLTQEELVQVGGNFLRLRNKVSSIFKLKYNFKKQFTCITVLKFAQVCSYVFVGELTAFCMGPSKASYCELKDNHDGTFVLKVKAQEPGRHVLQIKYGGEHVNGEC